MLLSMLLEGPELHSAVGHHMLGLGHHMVVGVRKLAEVRMLELGMGLG